MDEGVYTDFAITSATFLSKFTGLWWPRNAAEERQRKTSVIYMTVALVYGIYVNVVDIYHSWDDTNHCMFVILNATCIGMAIVKMLILNTKRAELGDTVLYAERHFWHSNYNSEEQMMFSLCAKHCTWFMTFAFVALPTALTGYVITPVVANRGRNKTDRIHPVKMWVDWPLTETPYYELVFAFQVICVYLIGAAYIGTDMLLCVFNLHVVCQFRILQCRMLKFWNTKLAVMNDIIYSDHCYAALKSCVQHHQMLITFCQKLENVYTMLILVHVAMLSLLMGFDCYEILVFFKWYCTVGNLCKYLEPIFPINFLSDVGLINTADIDPTMALIFLFHGIGSLGHLCILTYTCHYIMEESMNITTAIYLGPWSTLPVNQVGNSVRSAIKFIMMRSLRPCCLTAGGFFPVTLETFTRLVSTTFSYFTLMRESFNRAEGGQYVE